jgi:hypothetical protein
MGCAVLKAPPSTKYGFSRIFLRLCWCLSELVTSPIQLIAHLRIKFCPPSVIEVPIGFIGDAEDLVVFLVAVVCRKLGKMEDGGA